MFCGVMICGRSAWMWPSPHAREVRLVHLFRHEEVVEERRAERVEPLGRRENHARVFQRVSEIIRSQHRSKVSHLHSRHNRRTHYVIIIPRIATLALAAVLYPSATKRLCSAHGQVQLGRRQVRRQSSRRPRRRSPYSRRRSSLPPSTPRRSSFPAAAPRAWRIPTSARFIFRPRSRRGSTARSPVPVAPAPKPPAEKTLTHGHHRARFAGNQARGETPDVHPALGAASHLRAHVESAALAERRAQEAEGQAQPAQKNLRQSRANIRT